MTDLDVHPFAAVFPMLPADELDTLADSIAKHGLRQPIVTTPDGLILDGRNRAVACKRAGVPVETVTYHGDDVDAFVIAANVERRHMSTGARAMATAVVLARAGKRRDGKWLYGSLRERSETGSFGNQRLAEAGTVIDYTPSAAADVIAGRLPLSMAYLTACQARDLADHDPSHDPPPPRRLADDDDHPDDDAPPAAARIQLVPRPARTAEENEHARRTDSFSTTARALARLATIGDDSDLPGYWSRFDPDYLFPPQLDEMALQPDRLVAVRRLVDFLIEWNQKGRP